MRGRAQDSTIFPPQPLNLLAAHLFAHVAKLDEGHAGAPDLEDWDWLRVDEDLAELGVVTLTTARAPTPRLDVTWREDTSTVWFRWEGGRGLFFFQGGTIKTLGPAQSSQSCSAASRRR